jgi:hypothetical protein
MSGIDVDIKFDITAVGFRIRAMRGGETVASATGSTPGKVCEELGYWLTQWIELEERQSHPHAQTSSLGSCIHRGDIDTRPGW